MGGINIAGDITGSTPAQPHMDSVPRGTAASAGSAAGGGGGGAAEKEKAGASGVASGVQTPNQARARYQAASVEEIGDDEE